MTSFYCWQEPEQAVSTATDEIEIHLLEIPPTISDDKLSAPPDKPKEKDKDEFSKTRDPEKEKGKDKDKEGEKKVEKEMEKEKVKGVEGASLDSLLQRLPGCVSRDLIDQLTV